MGYCFVGLNKKKDVFQHLKICTATIEAVKAQKSLASVTDAAVGEKIQTWLKNAKTRKEKQDAAAAAAAK